MREGTSCSADLDLQAQAVELSYFEDPYNDWDKLLSCGAWLKTTEGALVPAPTNSASYLANQSDYGTTRVWWALED